MRYDHNCFFQLMHLDKNIHNLSGSFLINITGWLICKYQIRIIDQCSCDCSFAYCAIVRSEENMPALAMFIRHLRAKDNSSR